MLPPSVASVHSHPLWIVGSGFPTLAPPSQGRRVQAGSEDAAALATALAASLVWVRFGEEPGGVLRRSRAVIVNSTHVLTTVAPPSPGSSLVASGAPASSTTVYLAVDGLQWSSVGRLEESYTQCAVLRDTFAARAAVPAGAPRWFGVRTQAWVNYTGGFVNGSCSGAVQDVDVDAGGGVDPLPGDGTDPSLAFADGVYVLPLGADEGLVSVPVETTLGGEVSLVSFPVTVGDEVSPGCGRISAVEVVDAVQRTSFDALRLHVEARVWPSGAWVPLFAPVNATGSRVVSTPVTTTVAIPLPLRAPAVQFRVYCIGTDITTGFAVDSFTVSVVPTRLLPPVTLTRMFPRAAPVEGVEVVEVAMGMSLSSAADTAVALTTVVQSTPTVTPIFYVGFGPNAEALSSRINNATGEVIVVPPPYVEGLGVSTVDLVVEACGVDVSLDFPATFTLYDTPEVMSLEPRALSRSGTASNMTLQLSSIFVSDDARVRITVDGEVSYIPLSFVPGSMGIW
jgi:hypothetical protein